MFYYIALLSVMFLMGCSPPLNNSSAAIDTDKSSEVSKHPVKPGAAVRLENSSPYKLQQNVVTAIQLVLLTEVYDGVMDVHISVSDGLILNTANTAQFQLSSHARYELPLSITAHQQGRYYINLHVVMRTNHRQTKRALSAIVQVGDELHLQKNSGAAGSTTSEESVVSMPAEETIIP